MGVATKTYPTFDCDAHIADYVEDWSRHLSKSERELVKDHYWVEDDAWYMEGQLVGDYQPQRGAKSRWYKGPSSRISGATQGATSGFSKPNLLHLSGPGMSKEIMYKLYNMELTDEQVEQVAHRGSIEPVPRLRDMDLMGIDQVLVVPIGLIGGDNMMTIRNARAAEAIARAYNNWVRQDYCDAAPGRLFPAGAIALQNPASAGREIHRIAKLGFPAVMIRPVDVHKQYPNQPMYHRIWQALEETEMVCGMHVVTAGPPHQDQYSPGELLQRAVSPRQLSGASQTLSFIFEGMTWLTGVLLSGFLERFPRLKMAIFEANAEWLPMALESCDRLYHLYGNQRLPNVANLPSETFQDRCVISFESDEEGVFRRAPYFENIGVWASDTYHHDGEDAWEAIAAMRALHVPEETQDKLMGGNARRFYGLEAQATMFTDTEPDWSTLPRPDWFPKQADLDREYARAGEPRRGLP